MKVVQNLLMVKTLNLNVGRYYFSRLHGHIHIEDKRLKKVLNIL